MNKPNTKVSFFRDKYGNFVVAQKPNSLILCWMSTKLIALLDVSSGVKSSFSTLGTTLMFAWSYLELTSGVNYFRRLLGFVVMLLIVIGYFKK